MLDHILVPLDGSPLAECALPHAVALAQAFDARVTLLQVLGQAQPPSRVQSIDPLSWHIRKAESGSYLDGLVPRLEKAGVPTEKALLEGRAAERIMEFAREQNVSLIILSSHGKSGLSGWNISGVVQKIILRACIPTMIVRAYQSVSSDLTSLRYKRVLVPLDCSQRAECVLPLATTLARFHESRLLLTHVVCRPEMPRRAPHTREEIELSEQLTRLNQEEAGKCLEQLESMLHLDTKIHLLVHDNATTALHQVVKQENVDLVMMSAHGYSGGTQWPYGNVALNFIAYGTTPLLIVQDLSQDELESTQAEMAAREYKGH